MAYSILKSSDWDWDTPPSNKLDIEFLLIALLKKGLLGPTTGHRSAILASPAAEAMKMLLHGHRVNKLTSSLIWPLGM